jgi:hypothetical protein
MDDATSLRGASANALEARKTKSASAEKPQLFFIFLIKQIFQTVNIYAEKSQIFSHG